MIWPLLIALISLPVVAQEEDIDVESLRILEDHLPVTEYSENNEEIQRTDSNTRFPHPYKHVPMKAILASPSERGHIKAGSKIVRLEDNKEVEVTESFYGKSYRLPDEFGFKYIISRDGKCRYKINISNFNSVEPEIALYEPPLKYTPAPTNIVRSDFDKKLKILPELTIMMGSVQGNYMKDLFNDDRASSGNSTQLGAHFATDWSLPIKAGAVIHYEKASYDLTGGSKINYSAVSLGPQFKSKDFSLLNQTLRFQTQLRFSPFARANAETPLGSANFKFNSADLLVSVEFPIQNRFGNFVLAPYFQRQWLTLKDQKEIVSLDASSGTNDSFGLSIAQVFQ